MVDGRNPAKQLIDSLSHYLQGFIHPRWLFGISSINSINKTNQVGQKKLVRFITMHKASYIAYVPWSKVAILGMVIPPLIGILLMGI